VSQKLYCGPQCPQKNSKKDKLKYKIKCHTEYNTQGTEKLGPGYLTAAGRELLRYKLDLFGVQDVRWDKRCTVRAGDHIFSMEKETKIIN